jgi:hypothetical protein
VRAAQCLLVTVLLAVPHRADAEWQFKPFLGFTFGPYTTFVDPDVVAGSVPATEELESGSSHLTYGIAVTLLGEIFGLEADLGRVPGFFEGEPREAPGVPGGTLGGLVETSSVQTLTGNLVAAVPRRLSRYGLRPYVVAGFGTMTLRIQDGPPLNQYDVEDRVSVVDFGGGATGFFTDRVGVSWDLRHFRAVGTEPGTGLSENGELSFWRANMALVLRY